MPIVDPAGPRLRVPPGWAAPPDPGLCGVLGRARLWALHDEGGPPPPTGGTTEAAAAVVSGNGQDTAERVAVGHAFAGAAAGSAPTLRPGRPDRRVAVALNPTAVGDRTWLVEVSAMGAVRLRLEIPLAADEHLAGGGEQFGSLDLRGRRLDGWLVDGAGPNSYLHAPLLYSSAGWMLVVDTTLRHLLDCGSHDPAVLAIEVPGDALRLVVVEAPPDVALQRLVELTGLPTMPPAWAFGVWHNVRGGDERVIEQANRLRAERVPGSALWIEDHHDLETNDGDGWPGQYAQGEYRDMAALVNAVHELDFRALTYMNPLVYRGTPVAVEAVERGLVLTAADGSPRWQRFYHPLHGRSGDVDFEDGVAVLLDFTNPETVQWWRGLVRRLLVDRGWDGWMEDFGEQVPPDAVLHDGTRGLEQHNRYALLYHGATAAERDQTAPDSVVFARSGHLGIQALTPVVWGGDQTCSWDRTWGLPAVIPAGLSAALMGISSWGLDISGIVHVEPTPLEEGAADRELWMRWTWAGALAPVMRTHLGFKPQVSPPLDVWHDPEMTAVFREAARLHLRLLPHLLRLAAEAAAGGLPVMRPMLLHHPHESVAWTCNDQWMLGEDLLVAPVVERGVTSRPVWVPPGRWTLFGTDVECEGPAVVTLDAPVSAPPPLLQRDGSVVALLAGTPQSVAGVRPDREWDADLELAVTTGGSGQWTLADGTEIRLENDLVSVRGCVRTVLVRVHGAFCALARGDDLVFDVSTSARLREHARAGQPLTPGAGDRAQEPSLVHGYDVSPAPARPGVPLQLRVQEAEGCDRPVSLHAAWHGTGAAGETELVRSADGSWTGVIPPRTDAGLLTWTISGITATGSAVEVDDAGPVIDQPDVEVAVGRPRQTVFAAAVSTRRVPMWFREATMYHLLVDRFAAHGGRELPHDGDIRFLQHAGGTLRGVLEHLDHLADLGVDTLLLSPVTPGQMHVGYDVTDLTGVDPRLGTLDDMRDLLREAHAGGMRVILDSEWSYLGVRHPVAMRAIADAASPEADWFRWHERPRRPWSWFGGRLFMTLDHAHPAARAELLRALRFWAEMGVDGFRLDSAPSAPLDFWSEMAWVLQEINPEAVLLAEAFGTVQHLGAWRGRADAVLDYASCHPLRAALARDEMNAVELADALAPALGDDPATLVHPTFIENHDVMRFSWEAGGDLTRLHLATAAMLTLGPPPILYYGTEVGRAQVRGADMDPDARLPLRWNAPWDEATHALTRRLVHLRRDRSELRRGAHIPLLADARGGWAWARVDGSDAAVVVANISAAPQTLDVPLRGLVPEATLLRDALSPTVARVVHDTVRVLLPPRGIAVLLQTAVHG